jgi:FlaG/FlaF family flagellin (archaellin)
MKKVFLLLVVLIAAFATYWFGFRKTDHGPDAPPPKPIEVTNNSSKVNMSVDSIIAGYLSIKNAFVESDTVAVKSATKNLVAVLDNFPFKELEKDTTAVAATVQMTIDGIKANATSLLSQTDITEMRHDFNMVFETMYPSLFTAINYKGQKLFVEKCPMAFGDDMPASWISNSSEIVNPYLGKTHPKYKATMLNCGEVVDSVMAK